MSLIHETHDEYGVIRVIDEGKHRLLSFGEMDEQSRILLKTPHILQHEYTQAMLLSLMDNTPKRACILGLGGGALLHALTQAISGIHITAVELREPIIDVAKEFFRLPQSKRIELIHQDAIEFLSNNKSKKFDILFTDLYQNSGMDKRVATETFLTDAKQQLKADGILVLNCWIEHQHNQNLKSTLRELFSSVKALDTGSGNWVVLATNTPHELNQKQQKDECARLTQTLGFPLVRWLSRLEDVL